MFDQILHECELGLKLQRHGVFTFRDALKFVNELPYGRNIDKGIDIILEEGKGTCSTKHAFLAVLATENHLPVKLMLGYYLMNQENTPQIGGTLEKHCLAYLLEAHCYLKFYNQILDITFPGDIKSKLNFQIFDEQEILPYDLDKKELMHKARLTEWLKEYPAYPIQNLERLWEIRECCIQAACD